MAYHKICTRYKPTDRIFSSTLIHGFSQLGIAADVNDVAIPEAGGILQKRGLDLLELRLHVRHETFRRQGHPALLALLSWPISAGQHAAGRLQIPGADLGRERGGDGVREHNREVLKIGCHRAYAFSLHTPERPCLEQ